MFQSTCSIISKGQVRGGGGGCGASSTWCFAYSLHCECTPWSLSLMCCCSFLSFSRATRLPCYRFVACHETFHLCLVTCECNVLREPNSICPQGCINVPAFLSFPHEEWLPPNAVVDGPALPSAHNTPADEMMQVTRGMQLSLGGDVSL